MAFASVGTLGTGLSSANNQVSLVLTTTAVAEVGRLVVLAIAVDNVQTTDGASTAVSSVTNTGGGNTWTRAIGFANGQGAAQAGADISIWYSVLTTQINSGGTITATFANAALADASAMSAWKFSVGAGSTVAIEGTPAGLANDGQAAGSLNVTTSNISCLRFRAIASESSSATALVKTAAFTSLITLARSGTGTSATEMGVRGEWLISTSTGQASAPTGLRTEWTGRAPGECDHDHFRRAISGGLDHCLFGSACGFVWQWHSCIKFGDADANSKE